MDLQTAKKEIAVQSKAQGKKKLYLAVDDDGEVTVTDKYDKDTCGFAYQNGREVPLPPHVLQSESKETKISKTHKQTAEADSSTSMKNKIGKAPKKSAKATALSAVRGDKKTLTVKAITLLLNKGVKVYRQSAPNANGLLNPKRTAKAKNQEKEMAVIVVKA